MDKFKAQPLITYIVISTGRPIFMSFNQTFFDKTAIALSTLCALHCLALPILIAAVPLVSTLNFSGEAAHRILLLAVVPVSAIAIWQGCRKHWLGLQLGAGLMLMVLAASVGHTLLGESGEKALTLTGAAVLMWGHWKNYRMCRKRECACGNTA